MIIAAPPGPTPGRAPVVDSPPPVAPPTGLPARSPPPVPSRTGVVIVVAIVVVALLAVGGLWAAGLGPFAHSSGRTVQQSFGEAVASAQGAAGGVPGGPWTVAGGVGDAWDRTVVENNAAFGNGIPASGCQVSMLDTAPTITIPSSTVSGASGTATAWVIWFAGDGAELYVTVLGGDAIPYAKITGTCPLIESGAKLSLPLGYVDSPAAATAAVAEGGSGFLANHSRVDLSYTLSPTISYSNIGGTHVQSGEWSIEITNCDETGSTGTTLDGKPPATFSDQVNVSSGLAQPGTGGPTSCPRSVNAASAVVPSFGGITENVVGRGGGTWWYNTTVESAPAGMTWGDLTFQVESESGAVISNGPAGVSVTDAVGSCLEASYSFSTGAWSAPATDPCATTLGGSAAVLPGAQLALSSTADLASVGDWVVVTPHGAPGSSAFLPIP